VESLPKRVALWQALLAQPETLLATCRRETYQGSGAGGQKRNRVRSGMRLLHDATGLRAENCEHREAARNVAEALHSLRLQIAVKLGGLAETEAPPPEARARFRVETNASHADYPISAAVSICAMRATQGRVAEAALSLGCSGSALTRHFKADKNIWAEVLRMRAEEGLGPLK
jgi:RF-1 domain